MVNEDYCISRGNFFFRVNPTAGGDHITNPSSANPSTATATTNNTQQHNTTNNTNSANTNAPAGNNNSANTHHVQHALLSVFSDYTKCPHHRNMINVLSAVIQAITVQCPGAMVWHNLGDTNAAHNSLFGSPLDLLPCAPSSLPMPFGVQNTFVSSDNLSSDRVA